MRNVPFYILLLTLTVSNMSCSPELPPNIQPCVWNKTTNVLIENIQLRAPTGMSNLYYGSIPGDRIIKNLQQPLWSGDFWSSSNNKAKISGSLTSNGSKCTGQSSYDYPAGSNKIGLNFLTLNVPSNDFLGSATVFIRSDDYKKSSDPTIAQYIVWQGTSNDPEYNRINGNIYGSKEEYRPSTGKIPIQGVACYYINGQLMCP